MKTGDCGVCIGDFDGEPVQFSVRRMVIARKPHKCCDCNETIPIGTKHELLTYKFEGRFWRDRTCAICTEIGLAMSCGGGWPSGFLWDSIREMVFPDMTPGCLDRLQTARAKEVLLARWQAWKGLVARPSPAI